MLVWGLRFLWGFLAFGYFGFRFVFVVLFFGGLFLLFWFFFFLRVLWGFGFGVVGCLGFFSQNNNFEK